MIIPRWLLILANRIGVLNEFKDVECPECGAILGTYKTLERTEFAVEQHYIDKHNELEAK